MLFTFKLGRSKGSMSGNAKTDSRYGATMLDDTLSVGINIKFMVRLLVLCVLLGWYAMHLLDRLESVEERLLEASGQIRTILDQQMAQQQEKQAELEEQIKFYEKEFNINPFSWGKKRKMK